MNFLRVSSNQQLRGIIVLATMVVALIMAMIVPAFTSAAQVTQRSIALSSSSKGATGVTYQVNFTATQSAGAFLIDFCSNSPLPGDTCTAPTGFDASGASSSTSGFTDVTGSTNRVVVAGTIGASSTVSVDIAGIKNPTNAGPLYARIMTYDTKANASAYTAGSSDFGAGAQDQGGVAMAITDTIGVSGAVLESMTFCAAGGPISPDCNLASNTPATLKLGKNVGGVMALDSDDVYTGSIYTQVSTNAANGAVISLKSDALNCGGMIRSSDPSACDIKPAGIGANTVTKGKAQFGVMTGATSSDADGTIEPSANYNSSLYHMNYVAGNTSGVTSTYGDTLLDTAGQPANNKNMQLTFGASVSNNTPAGNYAANLSLVATGKF